VTQTAVAPLLIVWGETRVWMGRCCPRLCCGCGLAGQQLALSAGSGATRAPASRCEPPLLAHLPSLELGQRFEITFEVYVGEVVRAAARKVEPGAGARTGWGWPCRNATVTLGLSLQLGNRGDHTWRKRVADQRGFRGEPGEPVLV
jgi:hypothetical protein